jgi:hypothetical protein
MQKFDTESTQAKPQHTYISLSSIPNIFEGPAKARDTVYKTKHKTNCIYLGILPNSTGCKKQEIIYGVVSIIQ